MKTLIFIFLVSLSLSCSEDAKNTTDININIDTGIDLATNDAQTFDDVGTKADLVADTASDLGDEDTGSQKLPIFEPGAHNVGYRSWSFTYDTKSQGTRELRLSVWYPTADTEGSDARYYNLLNRPGIFDSASVVDDTFPVVVFSHGNAGFGEQSYYFAEFLTSHGFVVVAPDHTGNTFRDNTASFFEASGFRPQDISATIDVMQSLPADDPLFGKLTDDIALSGHSLGGFTTLAASGATFNVAGAELACQNGQLPAAFCTFFENGGKELYEAGFLDSRIKVAIPMAPIGATFFGMGVGNITIPTLMITAGKDQTLPNSTEGDPLWAQFTAPATRIDITLGGHFTFTSLCAFAGTMPRLANDGCSDAFIPPAEAFVIINAFSLAFLKKKLLGESTYDAFLSTAGDYASDISLSTK